MISGLLIKYRDDKLQSFEKLRYFYLITMLSCLFVRNIGIYLFAPPIIEIVLFSALGIVGVAVLALGILTQNIVIDFKENIFLILFIVCLAISSFINIKYGFFRNFKDSLWTLISFFVLYISAKGETCQRKIKLLINIQNMIIVTWFVLASLSVLTGVIRMSWIYEIRPNSWVGIGWVEGRLFGVFLNPNSASIISFFALIFSAFQLAYPCESGLRKKFNIANIALQYVYIALSESRGTCMVLLFAVAVVASVVAYNKLTFKKRIKILLSFLIGAGSCLCALLLITAITKLFSFIASFISLFMCKGSIYNSQTASQKIPVQRTDFIDNNDISNLRFKIWISAWEIFQKKWLFGVSPGNVVIYAKSILPATFIAKRGYMRAHSVWVGIPLYTGVCGAICLFGFFIKCFLKSVKYYICIGAEKVTPIFNLCTLVVLSVWVYGTVESEILFVNSVCSFVFWTFLGFAMSYLQRVKCE